MVHNCEVGMDWLPESRCVKVLKCYRFKIKGIFHCIVAQLFLRYHRKHKLFYSFSQTVEKTVIFASLPPLLHTAEGLAVIRLLLLLTKIID